MGSYLSFFLSQLILVLRKYNPCPWIQDGKALQHTVNGKVLYAASAHSDIIDPNGPPWFRLYTQSGTEFFFVFVFLIFERNILPNIFGTTRVIFLLGPNRKRLETTEHACLLTLIFFEMCLWRKESCWWSMLYDDPSRTISQARSSYHIKKLSIFLKNVTVSGAEEWDI